MAENYTTYTEVDPGSQIAITSTTRIDFTGLPRNVDAYVYADKGVDYYSGDFEFDLDITPTNGSSSTASGVAAVWATTNDIDDYSGLATASKSFLTVVMNAQSDNDDSYFYLREHYSGTTYVDAYGVYTKGTTYYLKIKRDESVGTYGTLYCDIYSSAADRTTQTGALDNLVLTLHAKLDFRYLFALNSANLGTSPAITGYVENLNQIAPITASFTVAGTSTVSMAPTIKKEASFTVAGTSTVSMAPQNPKRASFTVAGTSTVSMAPLGGIIQIQASFTVAAVSTVSMAPTGGYIPVNASMTVAGVSTVSMAPTAKLSASMTIAGVSTVSMAPVSLLPLHPYTALGFPAGYEATMEYKVLDIAKAIVQDWTNTDVVETATGVTGYSVYDVIIRLERGFQGLILWRIPGTTYHAEEPIDLTPLAYPTLLEMKLGGIALETTAQSRLATASYTAPDNAGIAANGVAIVALQTDTAFLLAIVKNKRYLKKTAGTWYLVIRNDDDSADLVNKALKGPDGTIDITDIAAAAMGMEIKSSV